MDPNRPFIIVQPTDNRGYNAHTAINRTDGRTAVGYNATNAASGANVQGQLVQNQNQAVYIQYFHLTLKDRNHNCGCRPDDPLCCSCCNLWLSSHFWSLFFMIEIPLFLAALDSWNWNTYIDVIVYAALALIFGVIPSISYIYSVYKCNYCLIYYLRLIIWIHYGYCILFIIAAFEGSAYDTYKGDTDIIAILVLWSVIAIFLCAWADNVFTKTQVWAKYFKVDNGVYPHNLTMRDFSKSYVCCMRGCCSCGC